MPPEAEVEDVQDEQAPSQEENARLQTELAAARAEADRYRQRYEGEAAKTAQAERLAAIEEAGKYTAEEQAELDEYGEVDPKGVRAQEIREAAQRRREAALLEAGAASRSAPAPTPDFGTSMDTLMGGAAWRETIRDPAYAEWFGAQPASLRQAVEAGDVAASVRAITLFDASRTKEGDTVRRADPRLDGARNAPGDLRIRSTQTRSGRATARGPEIDEDDYMAGWDYAGKDFEDDYRMLDPSRRAGLNEAVRERHGR